MVIQIAKLTAEASRVEPRLGRLARAKRKRIAQAGIVLQSINGGAQGGRIARSNADTVLFVCKQFGRAAGIGDNDGTAAGHCFGDGQPKRFRLGARMNDPIQCAIDWGGVFLEIDEADMAFNSQSFGFCL
jgi:hypothetical protein